MADSALSGGEDPERGPGGSRVVQVRVVQVRVVRVRVVQVDADESK
ncbi:hypothetical protein [Streptomyces odontomachi]|nr:hypothetical protein [Streptomyces sp. ODS25]